MTVPTSNGHTNGHVNGHNPAVGKTTTNGYTIAQKNQTGRTETLHESHVVAESSRTRTFTLDQQVTVLRQTVLTTRAKLICDLAHVDEHYIDSITVESFLEYIEHERLTYMPQRGSRWDKVLKWAEFFALQISGYEKAVGSFVPDSKAAARLIWASCRVLVEVSVVHWTLSSHLTLHSLAQRIRKRSKPPLQFSTRSDSRCHSFFSIMNYFH